MFVAAWEAYKEIAALLGVVALVVSVWKRRRIAIFVGAVVVGHWSMVVGIARVMWESWAEAGRWERVWLVPLMVAYLAIGAVIRLPKILMWEKELLMTAVRGYRTIEYVREAAERWSNDVRYGSDVRKWWREGED